MARRWPVFVGVAALAVTGFLLFRPDTLLTRVPVDESLDEAFATPTTTVPGDPAGAAATTTGVETTTTGVETTTTTQAGPTIVSSGSFAGIDHSASGTASVYRQGERYVLRFEEDTEIQNGPDLYVWLLAADEYLSGEPGEYIDLGTLEGTVGSQNYELPASFDPTVHRAVLIWCLRFSVPFAAASLG